MRSSGTGSTGLGKQKRSGNNSNNAMNKTVVTLLAALVALSALAQGTPPFRLDWQTTAGGGGTSSNALGRLRGTIGQPDPGTLKADNFGLVGGFWSVVATVQTAGAPYLTVGHTPTNTVVVCWPLPDAGWILQATTNLAAKPILWTEIGPPYLSNSTDLYFVEPLPVGQKYYRLHKP